MLLMAIVRKISVMSRFHSASYRVCNNLIIKKLAELVEAFLLDGAFTPDLLRANRGKTIDSVVSSGSVNSAITCC